MAREMALAGVDRSELTPPPPPKKPDTARGKWQNFWYHYRPLVIGGLVLLAIASVLIVQTVTKNPADYNVVVVTELALYPDEIDAMQRYLAACGEDLDGDGAVEVSIENLLPSYYDEAAPTVGHADQQKLMNYIATGEKMLYVFDRVSYDGFTETINNVTSDDYEFFAALNTAAEGYDPEAHCWCWSGDARLEEYGLSELPKEMLFGVRTPEGTAGGKKATQLYEQGAALLKTLSETA